LSCHYQNEPFANLGLVLSTNILRNFQEKVRKFETYYFCQKGQKNYLADVFGLLSLLEVYKCSLKLFHMIAIGNSGWQF
jgi:hypothetical protein